LREIWRHQHDGVEYRLHRRGQSLSLFANGVQHSGFRPDRLVTGSVWDLLWLPLLFHEPHRCRRVLVLGLGGGSLVPPLAHLARPEVFVGVENDAAHLEVARRFFGVEDFGVTTVHADARDWVAHASGVYDLVIDDLFAPANAQVTRAVDADRHWCRQLKRLVAPGGTLVMNFGDWPEFRHSGAASPAAGKGWHRCFRLATPDCHNAVMAWLSRDASSAQLRQRLRSYPELERALEQRRLQYWLRRWF